MTGVDAVTSVTRDGHADVGVVLGRAFEDDPLWKATFPDPDRRLQQLVDMFTALSRATVAAGGAVDVTPNTTAAALWLPPGRDIGLWSMVRSRLGLPRFTLSLPSSERRVMMGVLRQFDDRRKDLMPEPHWYLSAVGVDPWHQGQGLGSALLRAGIRRADREAAPIYLETETEGNVRFYRRLGFDVLEATAAEALGLPIWLMLRPLDSGASS